MSSKISNINYNTIPNIKTIVCALCVVDMDVNWQTFLNDFMLI